MNDMRERLIDLCKTAQAEWLEKEYNQETDKSLEEYVADHLLANGVTVQEWISVNDRLPEVGDDVIVAVFDGYGADTIIDSIMNDGKWCCSRGNQKVTHWQPMPQPPKGE